MLFILFVYLVDYFDQYGKLVANFASTTDQVACTSAVRSR